MIVGQSQGGAGAVAASSYSATYAPDLNIKGSIGTGVIYQDPEATPEKSVKVKSLRSQPITGLWHL